MLRIQKIPASVLLAVSVVWTFLVFLLFVPIFAMIGTSAGWYDEHTSEVLIGLISPFRDGVLVLSLVLLISQYYLVRFSWVPENRLGSSMAPTLNAGDMYLVDILSVRLNRPINRGDIVVFRTPKNLIDYPRMIKRVIGLPGDCIRVRKGIGVYINDQLLEEPYIDSPPMYALDTLGDIKGTFTTSSGNKKSVAPYANAAQLDQPIVVPEGCFFVLGDNRSKSFDSHNFGFIERATVEGRFWKFIWRAKVVASNDKTKSPATCYFCDASEFEVKTIVAGPSINICDACIASYSSMLKSIDATGNCTRTVSCSFCSKTADYERTAGKEQRICLECLSLCDEILGERDSEIELKSALSKDPNDTDALYMRARLRIKSGQYQAALDDLNRCIKLKPNSAPMLTSRALVYRHLKLLAESISDATKAIECDGDNAEAYHERAEAYCERAEADGDRADYEKAIQDLTRQIELNPKNDNAYVSRSHHRIQIEQYADAVADCDRAIELKPDDAVAYNNRARANLALQKYEVALQDIERAIELDGKRYAIFFYNRGLIYRALGKLDLAAADFRSAAAINPGLEKAQRALAELTASQPTS